MKHEMTESGGVTILRVLEENLDALTAPGARPLVDQLVDRGGIKVVFDMRSVRIIDSSGVGIVVSLFKRLRAIGGAVRFTGVDGQPKEIFHLMRLERVLAIFPTIEDALKGF